TAPAGSHRFPTGAAATIMSRPYPNGARVSTAIGPRSRTTRLVSEAPSSAPPAMDTPSTARPSPPSFNSRSTKTTYVAPETPENRLAIAIEAVDATALCVRLELDTEGSAPRSDPTPEPVLELAVVVLDPPPDLGQTHQGPQHGVRGQTGSQYSVGAS